MALCDFNMDAKIDDQIRKKYYDAIVANSSALYQQNGQPTTDTNHAAIWLDHFI